MRKQWFGDSRDYVKWSCVRAEAEPCLAVVYAPMLGEDSYSGEKLDKVVYNFFNKHKDFGIIGELFTRGFTYLPDTYEIVKSDDYFDKLHNLIVTQQSISNILVFLDPDTGIEPSRSRPDNTHLRKRDMGRVGKLLRTGEKLIVYQHASREHGWQNVKAQELSSLAADMGMKLSKPYHEPDTAKDVCFFVFTKT